MTGGLKVVLLALLATATARPEPQFIYSAGPYFGTALTAAYTAPASVAPVASVVPALPLPTTMNTYSGLYPSAVSAYAYGYRSTFSEVPVLNPSANLLYNSAYTSLPSSSLPYTNLPYVDYFTYSR